MGINSMELFLKQLRENWMMLILLGSIIISWSMFSARLTQAETDIKDFKVTIAEITDIRIQVQRIDTSVEFIKQRVK